MNRIKKATRLSKREMTLARALDGQGKQTQALIRQAQDAVKEIQNMNHAVLMFAVNLDGVVKSQPSFFDLTTDEAMIKLKALLDTTDSASRENLVSTSMHVAGLCMVLLSNALRMPKIEKEITGDTEPEGPADHGAASGDEEKASGGDSEESLLSTAAL